MKTKPKIIILLMFLIISCSVKKKQSFPEVLNSDERLVYLEGHNESSDKYSFDFMDVVVLDRKTGKKFYVTDDVFYDLAPAISDDGDYISFVSARRFSSYTSYKIQGIGGPSQFYLYNLKTKTMKEILLDEKIKNHLDYYGYYFYKDTTEFIFSTDQAIKIINVKTNEQKTVKEIKDIELPKWEMSRNKEIIVVAGSDKLAGYQKTMIIWNLRTGEEIRVPILEGTAYIGDIDTDKGKVLYSIAKKKKTSKLYEYYIDRNESHEIKLPEGRIEFSFYNDFSYTKEGNIIGIAYIYKSAENKSYENRRKEVVEYNIKERKYKILTNDGLVKYDLKYWYKK